MTSQVHVVGQCVPEMSRERGHATLDINHSTDRLGLLLGLNEAVASSLPFQEMIRAMVASLRAGVRCDAVAVFLSDDEAGRLRLCARAPSDGGAPSLPAVQDLLGAVFRSRRPWIGNLAELFERTESESLSDSFRSGCVLPLAARDRAVGVLALGRSGERAFSSDALEFLAQLGKQIAVAVEYSKAVAELAHLKARHHLHKLAPDDGAGSALHFGRIDGRSPALRRALKQIEAVSPTDSTVLLHGETGTGKELLAQAVHELSPRRAGPLVKLNCAAIPTGLLESELFGHEKGAFTSASAQRIGRFEMADGGTLLLDEVAEIPLELQPKLLRVLQEREFERLGGMRTLRTDTRVVAATNRDLKSMVERGTFRADLFYRLHVFPIHVPALRDRPEDIPLLIRHYTAELSRRMHKSIDGIPSSTMTELCRYSWPGNVRELQNVLERALILSSGPVLEVDLADLMPHHSPPRLTEAKVQSLPLKSVREGLQQIQRDEILRALREAGGRVGGADGAAARLGLKRTTLIARMSRLGIEARPAAA
jgi:formate hydrogenlyase transcriptional activator